MDGLHTFPHTQAGRRQRGDEPQCARLQHETGYENHRHRRLVESDGGVKALAFAVPEGAKERHKRSVALPVLVGAKTWEIDSARRAWLRHSRYESVFTRSGPGVDCCNRLVSAKS